MPPLTPHEAVVEASRCYFCYDAPCMEACPTGIDIPGFIKKIATDNLRGSALKIFEQQAGALGISGVPFYVLDTRFGVSGAQPAATFTAVLDKAWEQRDTTPS